MERIPILQMGEFLLVTIQVDMHDHLAMSLQDDLTNRITQTNASGVRMQIRGFLESSYVVANILELQMRSCMTECVPQCVLCNSSRVQRSAANTKSML